MKQTFIILVTLLVTFSLVNAIPFRLHKRATTFAPCPSGSPTVLTISFQPDPPTPSTTELFTISGTAANEFDQGATFVLELVDTSGNIINPPIPVVQDLCSALGDTCPITVGSPFTATGQLTMPDTLPPQYNIFIAIMDASNNTLACSIGTVTGS